MPRAIMCVGARIINATRGPCLQGADVAAAAMRREVDNARASVLRGKQAGDRNNEGCTDPPPCRSKSRTKEIQSPP